MRGCRQGRPVASLFVCRPSSLGGRYPEKVNSPRELSVDANTSGSRFLKQFFCCCGSSPQKGEKKELGSKRITPPRPTLLSHSPPRHSTEAKGHLLPFTPRCLDLGPPHRPSPTFLPILEFWRSSGARLGEARMCPPPTPPTHARSEARGPGDPDVGRSDRPSAESPCKLGKEAPHPPPTPLENLGPSSSLAPHAHFEHHSVGDGRRRSDPSKIGRT